MKFGEMLAYTKRLNEILNGPAELRFSRLKTLSDDLLAFEEVANDTFAKQMFYTVMEEMYAV